MAVRKQLQSLENVTTESDLRTVTLKNTYKSVQFLIVIQNQLFICNDDSQKVTLGVC